MQQTSVDDRFDASQYAFFGGDVSQEVELGGLDEEDDIGLGGAVEDDDDRLTGLSEKEEVGTLDAVSQLDDISEISSSYMNLHLGPAYEPEIDQDVPKWSPHQQPQVFQESQRVRRPSYPSQQQWVGTEPGFSQMAFPMVGPHRSSWPQSTIQDGQQHAAAHGHMGINYRSQFQAPWSHQMGGDLPSLLPYGGNHVLTTPAPPGPWLAPPSMQLGGSAGVLSGLLSHQMAQQHASMPPHVLLQRQSGHPVMPSAYTQRSSYNPIPSAPPLVVRHNDYFNTGDARDQRNDQQRARQTMRHYQQSPTDFSNRNKSRQQFRSQYMTSEEIESILRMQLAATHITDPYIDDYYHQAVQAKIADGTPHGRRHFAPTQLRDSPSHTRAPALQPTFLPVDGLGRVPFSSIRRPRPLLDVDSGSQGGIETFHDITSSERPLEQEPMLAARIAIEDGLCLLLDVDDIDRFLSVNQAPDDKIQLKRHRQFLLEGLAASLQLVDPISASTSGDSGMSEKYGQFAGLAAKDDFVFLRLVSLPKGRKLVYRYLQRLPPGSRLVQVVCMAVFRHLRFLFGSPQSDPDGEAATLGLAKAVSNCVLKMDLNMLSECIKATILSSEQPPLRRLGSPSGGWATVILRSALDRATHLLTDQTFTFSLEVRSKWQEAFDDFFILLSKYCTNKYDGIIHSLMMSSPGNSSGNSAAISKAAAEAMSKEMPVELLQASLPHMNELQRKLLLDFAQRSMATGGLGGHSDRDTHVSTAAVPG